MGLYKLGSVGEEVRQIQQELAGLGLYTGSLDGRFGGGTQSAVVAFQKRRSLPMDGAVDAATWSALFGQPIPEPAIAGQPIAQRCLALTGCFETSSGAPDCFSAVTGDADQQGISFGALQWNFGAGTLQPILQGMLDQHADVMREVFQDNLPALRTALGGGKAQLMSWARSIQDPLRNSINEPWLGLFKALGRTAECQALQLQGAAGYRAAADKVLARYALWSERGSALAFDLMVQNGSIPPSVDALIQADFAALPITLSDEDREVARMQILANRRADACRPAYQEDVRRRKLCIANGTGVVHGTSYDLAAQFGIALRKLV